MTGFPTADCYSRQSTVGNTQSGYRLPTADCNSRQSVVGNSVSMCRLGARAGRIGAPARPAP
eukprot:5092005-Prymnesium_polylepis.1